MSRPIRLPREDESLESFLGQPVPVKENVRKIISIEKLGIGEKDV